MIEKQHFSNQDIITCLESAYGIQVLKLMFLPLGADMNASIYKATTQDKSYFIKLKKLEKFKKVKKLKQGLYQDESVMIVEMLHEAGIPVILPQKTIEGFSMQRFEDFILIVYPFVEGQDGFSRHLTDDQWQKLGKSLKQLHEIHVPITIRKRIRSESYSPKWREMVRSHFIEPNHFIQPNTEINQDDTALKLSNIEVVQDEIALQLSNIEAAQDEIALQLSNFIKNNRMKILRLVNRAEFLAQKARDQSETFVLCHSDIHGGNVLIDNNDNIYIVDWDDPIMAPKERDLMFIGGGIANVWNKLHEAELFYKGYGETEINHTILAYYRHERIVEDIALYIQGLLLTNAGNEDRSMMYQQFIDMFEPNGVVDIAFKTDENLIKK